MPKKLEECQHCGSLVDKDELAMVRPLGDAIGPMWCHVCRYCLPAGSILDLRANLTNREIAFVICNATNLILTAIAEAKKETEQYGNRI